MKKKILFLTIAVIMFAGLFSRKGFSESSVDVIWTQTNGPEGAAAFAIDVDPTDPDTIYFAPADPYGVIDDRVFKSVDGGNNWAQVLELGGVEPGERGGISDLAISPNYINDNTIYVTSYICDAFTWDLISGKIFKSTNEGNSWVQLNTIDRYWARLAISPDYVNDNTLFAGSDYDVGIFKSIDGGITWTEAGVGYTADRLWTIAISPNYANDNTLFAGGYSYSGGLFKSTDGGNNWIGASNGITDPAVLDVAISPNYANDNTLYAATRGGVFKSTNEGETWQAMNIGLPTAYIYSLAISPNYADDSTLYAGTVGGPFKSTDGGSSWIAINEGMGALNVGGLVLSPTYGPNYTLYAGTGGGVFKSTNKGESWTGINKGVIATNIDKIIISPNYASDRTTYASVFFGGGIFRTIDGGNNWTAINTGLISAAINDIAISPNFGNDNTLYAGIWGAYGCGPEGGVFKSTDSGNNWIAINNGLTDGRVEALGISPDYANDYTLYAGTWSGVFKTTDGGENWMGTSNVGLTGTCIRDIAISPNYANDDTLFVTTGYGQWGCGVSRSIDAGNSWTAVVDGLPERSMWWIDRIFISPNYTNDQTLYTTINYSLYPEDAGIYKSIDGGNNWEITGLAGVWIQDLIISPNYANDSTLYAIHAPLECGWCNMNIVSRSTDGGSNWETVNVEQVPAPILTLAFSPDYANDYTIYAGTLCAGVFKGCALSSALNILTGEIELLTGLTQGEQKSLTTKLDTTLARIADATTSYEEGKSNLAINQLNTAQNNLQAFINEINAKIKSGKIDKATGNELIEQTQKLIDLLEQLKVDYLT